MNHRHARIILFAIIVGVLLGGLLGWFWPGAALSVKWLGDLFLTALKMLIVPLMFAAVISGVTALGDVTKLGRIGGITIAYFVVTTGIAVAIGLLMVNLIQPGVGIDIGGGQIPEKIAGKEHISPIDILFQIVQPNVLEAASKTELLPVMLFAILLGAALTTIGPRGETAIRFFAGVNEAMMRLVVWLMYLAPVGIFAIVAARLGTAQTQGGLVAEITAVGLHVVTVLSALALHFVVLMLMLIFLARRGGAYLAAMSRALLTAFGTSSSAATMPLTMECAREAGIDQRSVRFVIPLATSVNLNGTALYEACAVMFIAQAYGIHMSFGHQVIIFVTATLAAVGASGIPEAGLVTMVIVLNAVGLPLEGIGLLLTVDWLLDRFRTSINVWGDAVGAAVVARYLPEAAPEPIPKYHQVH